MSEGNANLLNFSSYGAEDPGELSERLRGDTGYQARYGAAGDEWRGMVSSHETASGTRTEPRYRLAVFVEC